MSTDIQKAARRVVEENVRLRSLLRLRGVKDLEIEEYLQGSSNGTSENTPITDFLVPGHPSTPVSRVKPTRNAGMSVPLGEYDVLSQTSGAFAPMSERTEARPNDPATQPENSLLDCTSNDRNTDITAAPTPRPQPPPSPPRHTLHHKTPTTTTSPPQIPLKADNTTSCLLAANILAGMCCAKSAEEVSAELGCFPGADCEVDNVKLFQIMDR